MRKIRTDKTWTFTFLCILLLTLPNAAQSKIGAVTHISGDAAEINLGRMDGLQPNGEGAIYFEILVAGRKKEIPVATFKVVTADKDISQIKILSPTGAVKVGYRVRPTSTSPLTAHYFLAQGEEHFQAGEFEKAIPYYQKITEIIKEDPLAQRRIHECQHQIAERAARQQELEKVAYYRAAMKRLLEEKHPAEASEYAQRILRVAPEDAEALIVLSRASIQPTAIEVRAEIPSEPESAADAREAASERAIDRSRMVLVPGGGAMIGESAEHAHYINEQPAHSVTIKPFYMDKYEVTNAEYQRFVNATGHQPPPHWKGGTYPEGAAEHPVVQVTWDDAHAYAQWAGKRLPTEVEWEFAARGTEAHTWPWGSTDKKTAANTRRAQQKTAGKVGSYPDDCSPFGIFDMGGNVSEWTADWYMPYPGNPTPESDYGEKYKVLRGGSFSSDIAFARGAFRAHLKRDYKAADLGFRCAADP